MNEKDTVLTFLACGGMFIALIFFVIINANSVEKGYQIKGIVDKVAFTKKGIPQITIGGEIYTIRFPGNAFVDKIQVGDSIVKQNDSKIYRLIKKNSKEVILSK